MANITCEEIKDFPFPPQAGHQFLQLNYSGVTTLLEKSCLHNMFLRGDHSRVYTKCDTFRAFELMRVKVYLVGIAKYTS